MYDLVRYYIIPPIFLVFFTGVTQVLVSLGNPYRLVFFTGVTQVLVSLGNPYRLVFFTGVTQVLVSLGNRLEQYKKYLCQEL